MKTILLSDGVTTAIVDDKDYAKVIVKEWHVCKKNKKENTRIYARSGMKDMQRFLIPDIPEGHMIVFKNGNSLDCRRENMQVVKKKGYCVFKNIDRQKIKLTRAIKKSQKATAVVTKLPVVPQQKTDNFIGVHKKIITKSKFVNGELTPVDEIWYIAEYIDSNNRKYSFGQYKDPKIAATEYNKQVKLVALGLDEEVELNPKEVLV